MGESSRQRSAVLVTAPASGQGKTTVAAAMARAYARRGLRVRGFKTGPDFIDPTILEQATGAPVYQLDLWMGGEDDCRRRLHAAAGDADLIVVEGVMGLFDGSPSSADLAQRFGLPVLAVVDASAMAQTFGAVVHGLARHRADVRLAGVVANRTGGPGHAELLAESMPEDVPLWGWLERDRGLELPARHLGLVLAGELDDLDARLERAAAALDPALPERLPAGVFDAPEAASGTDPRRLVGRRVAVARDAAFAFVYRANLDVLRAMGAEPVAFSPLADEPVPAGADALYLPGGYPELHARTLAANRVASQSIRDLHADGAPILAECGGMLYLLESLAPVDAPPQPMVGLLPGHARMCETLTAIGMQSARLDGGTLRGHTFHHSRLEDGPTANLVTDNPLGRGVREAVFRSGGLTASYVHWYLPSAPAAAAGLLDPG